MGQVHQLILSRGIGAAKAASEAKRDRQCVDTAFAVLADEGQRVGIMHAGFAMTALPHKDTNEKVWLREQGGIRLRVESGADENSEVVGIPFGSIARMILLYLQSEAVKTRSRDIELGRSMNHWLQTMGIDNGGKTYRLVKEQSKRLSLCRLTFYKTTHSGTQITNGSFVRDAIIQREGSRDQLSLWRDVVRLDEGFYQSLISHSMPLQETAIRMIGAASMAIDVYIWLAYRLHSLDKPTAISWTAIFNQFGGGFKLVRQFKAKFRDTLALALAAYPDAHVLEQEDGLLLYPSKPPERAVRQAI